MIYKIMHLKLMIKLETYQKIMKVLLKLRKGIEILIWNLNFNFDKILTLK